jgi:hypothetical protein
MKKEFFSMVSGVMESSVIDQRVAIHNLVSIWGEELPIIKDVCRGHKSFEKIVEPIVRQNLQISFAHFFKRTCFSGEFWRKARDAGGVLSGILPLEGQFGQSLRVVDITSPLKVSLWQSLVLFLIPVVVAVVSFAIGYWAEIKYCYVVFDFSTFLIFLGLGIAVGSIFASVDTFLSATMHLKRRRHLARVARENAKYLDKTLKKVYQN